MRRFIVPCAITLLAVFLRVHYLSSFVTSVDHYYPISQAIGIVESGRWPLIGQYSSILFDNPPGMAYLLLLPWLFLRNIWGVHYVVVLLNGLAVPLVYAVMRVTGQVESRAEVAALLLAVNPWCILFSQGTWVQGLLVLLATLTFVLLTLGLFGPVRRRARRLLAALASLTLLTQTYLLAFLGVVQVGAGMASNKRRLAWRPVAVGGLIFIVATGFYVSQLLLRWPAQWNKISDYVAADQQKMEIRSTALEHAMRYVTGRDYEIVYGNDSSPQWQVRRALSLTVSWVLAIALILGIARAAWTFVRRGEEAAFWGTALLWWAIPIVTMTVVRFPVHTHYLLLTLPAGYLLVSPMLAGFFNSWKAGLATAVLVAVPLLLLEGANLQALARPAGGSLDHLSIRAVLPFQRAAGALVDDYGLSEFYVSWDSASLSAAAGHDLEAINWFDLPSFQIMPLDRPAVYIRLASGQSASTLPLASRVAQLNYPGQDSIAFDAIPAYSRAQIAALPQQRVEWPTAEGLTLLGYDLRSERELVVYWMVDGLVSGREEWLYVPYAHLTNDQGELVANIGATGIPGHLYRVGDVYIYRMEIPALAAGEYELELGLFDGIHGGVGVTFLPPGQVPKPVYTTMVTLGLPF
jgi:hypothetical protein